MGALLGLAGGLSHLLPHLFVGRHDDVPVVVPEEEAILEKLLYMGLSGFYSLHLLLEPLELNIPGCDLGLLLLILKTLFLDLCSGFSSRCRCLHKVAGFALRDLPVIKRLKKINLPEIAVDWWKMAAI